MTGSEPVNTGGDGDFFCRTNTASLSNGHSQESRGGLDDSFNSGGEGVGEGEVELH